jgi:hypothetical protein
VFAAMRNVIPALLMTLLAACGPTPQDELPLQSAAAIMLEVRPGAPLDSLLYTLDSYLARAQEGWLEGEAATDFRRAEALTDRLLEARMPFQWIPDQQYSLESRLRQIQSLADRVLAMLDTGVQRDTVLAELDILREEVIRTRQIVARGGTRAPPPIERLLELGADARAAGGAGAAGQQPGGPPPPTGPRPLGQAVPDTTNT